MPRVKHIGRRPSSSNAPSYHSSEDSPPTAPLEGFDSVPTPLLVKEEHLECYLERFAIRELMAPKFLDVEFFTSEGFNFIEILQDNRLIRFLGRQAKVYPEVVKAFYTTFKILDDDFLSFELYGKEHRLSHRMFGKLATLPQGEHKYKGELVPDALRNTYHKEAAKRALLINPDDMPKVLLAGSIQMEYRLLHYVLHYILIPRRSQHAQVLALDIFSLWAMLNYQDVDWCYYVLHHMATVAADDSYPLPYGMLITYLLERLGVDLSNEVPMPIPNTARFGKNTLSRMGFVKRRGQWVKKTEGPAAIEEEEAHHDGEMPQPQSSFHDQATSSAAATDTTALLLQEVREFRQEFRDFRQDVDGRMTVLEARFDILEEELRQIRQRLP